MISEGYRNRCLKRLKKWGAPLEGWECIGVYDMCDDGDCADLFQCELCDCAKVRYVHVMGHKKYFESIEVGCICAGVMEGDILAAKERDKQMKNRAKRKKNYLKKAWRQNCDGTHSIKYKNHRLEIIPYAGGVSLFVDGQPKNHPKGKPMKNFLTAVHAAFEIVDTLRH